MAEDLKGKLPHGPIDVLAPTSQGGGNMRSTNERALTAPGGNSVTPMPTVGVLEDPRIDVTDYDGHRSVHGEGDQPADRWDDVSGRREAWGP